MNNKVTAPIKKGPTTAIKELMSMFKPYSPASSLTAPAPAVGRLQTKRKWPDPLKPAALHGIAGEFVRAIEPHSEADPVALLIQFLVAFGNALGRTAHFRVEAGTHYLNLFCCLVGQSSRGRKGVSWSHVKKAAASLDYDWSKYRIKSGLSSGEGLIDAVRDAKKEKLRNGQVREIPGIADKRLLIYESEFARVLRVMAREGNSLDAVLRSAWDGEDLEVMTKNDPIRATAPHISIVTHVTEADLKRFMTDTIAANGFGNRFMWLGVKRSCLLPEGGQPEKWRMTNIHLKIRSLLKFAQARGELRRDDEAREAWAEIYQKLADDHDGLYGALTSRAEPQIMRLACLYALLDKSVIVRLEHLQAAYALWEYSDASVGYLFGGSLGDPVADAILANLIAKPEGLTKAGIHSIFSNQKSAEQISNALDRLEKRNLAYYVPEPTGGRPSERWFAR